MHFLLKSIVALAAALLTVVPATLAAQAEDQFAIEEVDGGLYRWSAGAYHSIFLVHGGGIVVGDPLSEEAATWLRDELEDRYPDLPVTHVIYSHSHPDHAYGGQALDDGATQFVAHELAAQTWELNRAQVRRPDITFDDTLTLTLPGGDEIRLDYWGANNGNGSISMLFPRHDALHIVDWIVLGRLPYQTLDGYDINGMIGSTRTVLSQLEFGTFIGGHAEIGDRADVERYLAYLEALHDGVLDGILAGKPLDRIQAEMDLSQWSDLKQFEAWRDANIEGVYNQLVDDYYVQMRPEVQQPATQ